LHFGELKVFKRGRAAVGRNAIFWWTQVVHILKHSASPLRAKKLILSDSISSRTIGRWTCHVVNCSGSFSRLILYATEAPVRAIAIHYREGRPAGGAFTGWSKKVSRYQQHNILRMTLFQAASVHTHKHSQVT